MNDSFLELMHNATRLTRAGQLSEATAAIQRALGGTTVGHPAPHPAARQAQQQAVPRGAFQAGTATAPSAAAANAIDGCVVEVADGACIEEAPSSLPGVAHAPTGRAAPWPEAAPGFRGDAGAARTSEREGDGEFLGGVHTHASLTREYKLYLPAGAAERARPLLVMLHGCTQGPDDFAAGTAMNALAAEQGFCVLYPAQAQEANPSRCWNWFKHNHQERGRGEPALIAAMTQAVMKAHHIDPRRVYLAGLSAGGAMAAIIGAAYPDIFAAVGVHSGLAPGAARSLPEALTAMRGTSAAAPPQPATAMRFGTPAMQPPAALPLPVIVFHGDQDTTVHPRNGEQVIAAAVRAAAARSAPADEARSSGPRVEQGVSAQGRHYTRSIHDAQGAQPAAEHWLLHGAGHAWSGGRTAGSYTDPRGPDASREMLRFFLAHPRQPVQ